MTYDLVKFLNAKTCNFCCFQISSKPEISVFPENELPFWNTSVQYKDSGVLIHRNTSYQQRLQRCRVHLLCLLCREFQAYIAAHLPPLAAREKENVKLNFRSLGTSYSIFKIQRDHWGRDEIEARDNNICEDGENKKERAKEWWKGGKNKEHNHDVNLQSSC